MRAPRDIYVYKMKADNGGAPCVWGRVLSLAICKPQIRNTAGKGDVVIGIGGKRLGMRVIYAAFVDLKAEDGEYYSDRSFQGRPDRIYRKVQGKPVRRADARFHVEHDERARDAGTDVGVVHG